MATTITNSCDPKQCWQQQAISELGLALGFPIEFWTYSPNEGWVLQDSPTRVSEQNNIALAAQLNNTEKARLLSRACEEGKTIAQQTTAGVHLLIIPLEKEAALITSIEAENPVALTGLADVASRYFSQQEEVARLREENDYFLKQVSDDFEELTFLRAMADRLGLGDSAHTVEQLVFSSMPELGKSVHAEELYYLVNQGEAVEIQSTWYADAGKRTLANYSDVKELLAKYRQKALSQPVIRNRFDNTIQGKEFPGIRDFVIVTVGEEEDAQGWYVAINRVIDSEDGKQLPEWQRNQRDYGSNEASLLETAAAMTSSHSNNLSLFHERKALLVNVVRTLVSAVEAKDQYTCGHSERVALYAQRLALQVGYDEEGCELIYLTGLLHDIGKIAINDAILNKPDKLTDEEFSEIQRHPEEGWKILQELQQLCYVLPGVLHHHERFDGLGYPDGLAGLDIPLDGRILAVVDAYDAMTSDRAYRTGMPHEKAVAILESGSGTQWDPEIIHAFVEIAHEFTVLRESYQPRDKPNRTPTLATM